jgi:hypothetical protein
VRIGVRTNREREPIREGEGGGTAAWPKGGKRARNSPSKFLMG